METEDLKGHLLARRENLRLALNECRKTVVLMEADLIKARCEADTTHGAMQATEGVLADFDRPGPPKSSL